MTVEAPPNQVLDLGYLWRVLAKRWWIVALAVCAAFAAALLYTAFATPIYTARTVLMIEEARLDMVDLADVLNRAMRTEDPSYDNTQYDILRSRSLAAQVIRSEGLAQEPMLAGEAAPFFEPGGPSAGDVAPWMVDRYLSEWLRIAPSPDSRMVTLSISSPDPELSARVANAHAQAYVGYGLGLRTQASLRGVEFLKGTLAELQGRVTASLDALEAFRERTGRAKLVGDESLVTTRLGTLQDRLATVELRRIELEAQIQLIEERGYASLAAVRESSVIRSLKDSLAEAESAYVQASAGLRAAAPQPLELKAQVEDARKRLQNEMFRVAQGVRAAYRASQREEESLRAELGNQRALAIEEQASSIEYAVLQHEVEVNQRLLQAVRERMKEMTVMSDVQASGVFVIDEAHPPLGPSHPRVALNLAAGLVAGFAIGLMLLFLVEVVDNRLRTSEDIERYLGLPVLGEIPDLTRLARRGGNALIDPAPRLPAAGSPPRRLLAAVSGGRVSAVALRPRDRLAAAANEAYRSVRTSLLLSQAGESPRSMLFTSTTTREGKTTTSINTALMYAQVSESVLLIDADLRLRRCSSLLGIDRESGLSELLTGQKKSIGPYRYGDAKIDIVPAGAAPPNPTELLGSDTMRQLLLSLRERYEYIVIDAPPLEPVSDALVLSTLVDGVVLVVDGQGAARQRVRDALNRLLKARAKLLGVVLNRVESRGSYAYYGDEYLRDEANQKQRA